MPNVDTMLMNRSSPPSCRSRSGTMISLRGVQLDLVARVRPELVEQRRQLRIVRRRDLSLEAGEQVRAPLAEVEDLRRHALGMQREPERVDRRRELLGRDALEQQRDARVGVQHLPVAVDDQRRIRLVALEHVAQRGAHGVVLRAALRIRGRVARRQQQVVGLAQRHVEPLREPHHHVPARLRAAGLDEAQVARRDVGLERQLELAEPPPGPPLAQQGTDRRFHAHDGSRGEQPRGEHDPGRDHRELDQAQRERLVGSRRRSR